jgi:hypothetical protein
MDAAAPEPAQPQAEAEPTTAPRKRLMRFRKWLGVGDKTLWDWLQLLIVPAILIGVTFAWSATQTRSDNKREDRRIAADRAAAEEARQDATLRAYLDQMSGLILHENLQRSGLLAPVRSVARTVTLTTLRRLGGERRGEVVRFLDEAGLLTIRTCPGGRGFLSCILARSVLNGADLSGANLRRAVLRYDDFRNVDLSGANLTGADIAHSDLKDGNFRAADLRGANLQDAELAGSDFKDAKLSGAELRNVRLWYVNVVQNQKVFPKHLDLGNFIARLQPDEKKEFVDSEIRELDSLSPAELAKFNLTREKLAKLRREVAPG